MMCDRFHYITLLILIFQMLLSKVTYKKCIQPPQELEWLLKCTYYATEHYYLFQLVVHEFLKGKFDGYLSM